MHVTRLSTLAALSEQAKGEAFQKEIDFLNKKATLIQALVRGVHGRARFKKLLPALKRLKVINSLCSECERVTAIKICRACKDQFCNDCFARLHRKGTVGCMFVYLFVFFFRLNLIYVISMAMNDGLPICLRSPTKA